MKPVSIGEDRITHGFLGHAKTAPIAGHGCSEVG